MTEKSDETAGDAPDITDLVGGPNFWPFTNDYVRHLLAENGVPPALLADHKEVGVQDD